MEKDELISIIMPVYNREKLLPIAIESVLKQTYENWELLIVDDRSTDNTKKVIEQYSQSDRRIRYLYNRRKKGPSGARNFGIENVQGYYLAFLDSDDEWFEYHLKESLAVLKESGQKVCFAGRYDRRSGKLIDVTGKGKGKIPLDDAVKALKPESKGCVFYFNQDFYRYNLTEKCHFFHINTMVIDKSILSIAGKFDESLPANEDYDLIFNIFYHFPFCYIDKAHFIYNEGPDNLYAFVDRASLNIEELTRNRSLVKKLSGNILYKIQMHKKRLRFIKNAKNIHDKRQCVQEIKKFISNKYFSIGFIHERINRVLAFKYYVKSLILNFSSLNCRFLFFLFGRSNIKDKFQKCHHIFNID